MALDHGVFKEVTHVWVVERVVRGEVCAYSETGFEALFALDDSSVTMRGGGGLGGWGEGRTKLEQELIIISSLIRVSW